MASEKNLSAVFKDIADAIREKSGNTEQMQPINMADNIKAINTSSLKNLLDKTKSCYNLFYRYNGASVKGLISYSDTSNVTNMNSMFISSSVLTTIPLLDTGSVTDMGSMFSQCAGLTTIPLLDTSNVKNMYGMFSGCTNLRSLPLLDTSNVTDMGSMFSGSRISKIPLFNTSNVTNMKSMFENNINLMEVPALDASNVTNMNYIFSSCTNLKTIYMKNIKVSLSISRTALQHDALVELINNGLATVTTTQTLTMGSAKLALLSDSEKQIALDKGWTLA